MVAEQHNSRPWISPGIGWIFAVIALVLAGFGLLDVVAIGPKIIQVEVALLALALLL